MIASINSIILIPQLLEPQAIDRKLPIPTDVTEAMPFQLTTVKLKQPKPKKARSTGTNRPTLFRAAIPSACKASW